MEHTKIQGEVRQLAGRHENDRLRKRGMVPAVIYGHKKPPEHIALSRHDTLLALSHGQHVIEVLIEGQEAQQYLVKDVQYDHLQIEPLHIDLMRVDPNERVQVQVPVQLKGTPVGVTEGGVLNQMLNELDIECRLLRIPQSIIKKINELKLNDTLHVRDLDLPEGVTVLNDPEDPVATIQPPREVPEEGAELETAAEEGAEPEVIGKGPEEDEGEGEGGD